MRVSFRMSGDLSGTVRGVDLEVDTLAEPERGRLQSLVEASRIEGCREAVSEESRDLPLYEIRILRRDGAASLVCDEEHVPAHARGLLRFLIDHATPMPPEEVR